MVTKLDWNEKDVADDLMQLLIHGHIVAKLFPDILILCTLEMASLSRVKDLAEHIRPFTVSLEANWLSKAASDNFAEELVLDAIVEEHRAAFNI